MSCFSQHVQKKFKGASIGSHSDKLNFSGGILSALANEAAGWTVTISDQHKKVSLVKIRKILSRSLNVG